MCDIGDFMTSWCENPRKTGHNCSIESTPDLPYNCIRVALVCIGAWPALNFNRGRASLCYLRTATPFGDGEPLSIVPFAVGAVRPRCMTRTPGPYLFGRSLASVAAAGHNSNLQQLRRINMTESTDVTALMREDSAKPKSGDTLVKLQKQIEELRELEFQRDDLNNRSKELGTKIYEIRTKKLVDLFDQVGVSKLGIPESGNLPAYEIELIDHVKANLGDLDEKDFAKAIAWLEKKGLGDMIKTTITVSFGMGKEEEVKRKKLVAFLEKLKISYGSSFGVPWNTLTAYVKAQLKAKKSLPLKLLGATVERTAALVKQKNTKKSDKPTTQKVKTPLKGKK